MGQENEQTILTINGKRAEAVITDQNVCFIGRCLGEVGRKYTKSQIPREAVRWVEIKNNKNVKRTKMIIGIIIAALVFITYIMVAGFGSAEESRNYAYSSANYMNSRSECDKEYDKRALGLAYIIIIDIVVAPIFFFIFFRNLNNNSYALFNCNGTYYAIDIKDKQTAFSLIQIFSDKRVL